MSDENSNPLISVIVPSYNHEKYITLCIESIMCQSYSNFELIVIDDGSSDNSVQILKKMQNKYFFRLITQENKGLSKTLNDAIINYSNGKYISICASDDLWVKDKLKIQVNYMEKNPECLMCFGKTYSIDKDSKVLKKSERIDKRLKGGDIFIRILTFRQHMPVNTMIRRKAFDIVGYYREDLVAEDYYMNLKISEVSPIGFIDKYLSYYRFDNSKKRIKKFIAVMNSHIETVKEFKHRPESKYALKLCYLRRSLVKSSVYGYKASSLMDLYKSGIIFHRYIPLILINIIRKW
jgi:alpha-1,3-rhamnosyltransferase